MVISKNIILNGRIVVPRSKYLLAEYAMKSLANKGWTV